MTETEADDQNQPLWSVENLKIMYILERKLLIKYLTFESCEYVNQMNRLTDIPVLLYIDFIYLILYNFYCTDSDNQMNISVSDSVVDINIDCTDLVRAGLGVIVKYFWFIATLQQVLG